MYYTRRAIIIFSLFILIFFCTKEYSCRNEIIVESQAKYSFAVKDESDKIEKRFLERNEHRLRICKQKGWSGG